MPRWGGRKTNQTNTTRADAVEGVVVGGIDTTNRETFECDFPCLKDGSGCIALTMIFRYASFSVKFWLSTFESIEYATFLLPKAALSIFFS